MRNILVDLSGKISETSVSILREIEEVSTRLDIPFFVIGATARDIILEYQFDIKTRRATLVIDIGVFISGWDQYFSLFCVITEDYHGYASKNKKQVHLP